MADSPLEIGNEVSTGSIEGQYRNLNISDFIKQELRKMVNEKGAGSGSDVNFAHIDDFAGSTLKLDFNSALSASSHIGSNSWIVDTGASNHMCNDISSLKKPVPTNKIIPVFLWLHEFC